MARGVLGQTVALAVDLAVRPVDAVDRQDHTTACPDQVSRSWATRSSPRLASASRVAQPVCTAGASACCTRGPDEFAEEAITPAWHDLLSSTPSNGRERCAAARRMCLTGSVSARRTTSMNRSTVKPGCGLPDLRGEENTERNVGWPVDVALWHAGVLVR
jgi:hypothetical protein